MFDPSDPFPYPFPGNYAEEKIHSAQVDSWLGMAIKACEKSLQPPEDGAQRWTHVPPETFLTPYTELRRMVEICRPVPGSLVVDLGAGYGRLGFVMALHSEANFLGLELVPERVRLGSEALARFGATRAALEVADLTKCALPAASLYFIYDYGTRPAVAHTLAQLQSRARETKITVVGRGRGVRDAIERDNPWLSAVMPPEHHGNFSVYRSAER